MTITAEKRILCVQYGKTVEDVIDMLSKRDGILRDILLYGQDMRSKQGGAGQPYDGPGGSGGAARAIPRMLALAVPYVPVDTRVAHKVLKDPIASEIVEDIRSFRPTCVIIHAGLKPRQGCDAGAEVLDSIPTPILKIQGELIEALNDVGVDILYLDATNCDQLAHRVRQETKADIVAWMCGEPPRVFHAYNFLFGFFGALDIGSTTSANAFALASELSCAFCLSKQTPNGPELPPSLPHLFSDKVPMLPGMEDPENLSERDGSCVDPAKEYPGYRDMRLCSPSAEVRLLVACLPHIMSSARLGSLCQGIRGIVAAEISSASLLNKTQVLIPPPYLPEGSCAYRCTMKSSSGIAFDVVAGGPFGIMKRDDILEYALRDTLTAEAHSIQLKLPPLGAPLPPYHSSQTVASGAPVVEVLASTSSWVVYLMKRICENPIYRAFVIAGIGAVSSTVNSAFSKRDALRQTSIVTNGLLSRVRPATGLVTSDMLVGAPMEAAALATMTSHGNRMIPTPAAVPNIAEPTDSKEPNGPSPTVGSH
ncbi:AT-rich interactive domain-containing protein 4 [Picochlorum sp. SENEW3]|nr:AT-rich interactive domain-containing protein 4 [Picochlorum sp. SENEW3]